MGVLVFQNYFLIPQNLRTLALTLISSPIVILQCNGSLAYSMHVNIKARVGLLPPKDFGHQGKDPMLCPLHVLQGLLRPKSTLLCLQVQKRRLAKKDDWILWFPLSQMPLCGVSCHPQPSGSVAKNPSPRT